MNFKKNQYTPSICSHNDIIDGGIITCVNCGRYVTKDSKGIKRFFLFNGVQYFTKVPKNLRIIFKNKEKS